MINKLSVIVTAVVLGALAPAQAGVIDFSTVTEDILTAQGLKLPQEEGDESVETMVKAWSVGDCMISSSDSLYASVSAVSIFGNFRLINAFGVSQSGDGTQSESVYLDSEEWLAFDFAKPMSNISFNVNAVQTGNAETIPDYPIKVEAFGRDGKSLGVASVFNAFASGPGLHGEHDLNDYFGPFAQITRVVITAPSSDGVPAFRGISIASLEYSAAIIRTPVRFGLHGMTPWGKKPRSRR